MTDAADLRRHAEMLGELKRWPEAYDAAVRVLQTDPGDVGARRLVATAALGVGRAGEAAKMASALVSAEPEDYAGWLLLARACSAHRKFPRAYQAARTAVGLAPNDPVAHGLLALLCVDVRRWEEAGIALQTLETLAPGTVLAHRIRGAVLLRAGDVSGARTALRAGLALAPADANLLTLLGSAEERAGRPGRASRAQRSALALDPATHAAAAGLRGRSRLLAGTASPASWWVTRLTAVTALLVVIGGSVVVLVRVAHVVVPTQDVTVGSSAVVGLLTAGFARAMGRRRPRQILAASSAPRARAEPGAYVSTDLHPPAGDTSSQTAAGRAEPVVRLRERRPELQAFMVGTFVAIFAGLFLAVGIHDALGWLIALLVAPAVASALLTVATRPRVRLVRRGGTAAGLPARTAHTALGCLTFPVDAALLIRDEMVVAPLIADRLLRVRAVPRVRTGS